MLRGHAMYIIVSILLAVAIQFVLVRRLRSTLKSPVRIEDEEQEP